MDLQCPIKAVINQSIMGRLAGALSAGGGSLTSPSPPLCPPPCMKQAVGPPHAPPPLACMQQAVSL